MSTDTTTPVPETIALGLTPEETTDAIAAIDYAVELFGGDVESAGNKVARHARAALEAGEAVSTVGAFQLEKALQVRDSEGDMVALVFGFAAVSPVREKVSDALSAQLEGVDPDELDAVTAEQVRALGIEVKEVEA